VYTMSGGTRGCAHHRLNDLLALDEIHRERTMKIEVLCPGATP
jgi:hypothetical protein